MGYGPQDFMNRMDDDVRPSLWDSGFRFFRRKEDEGPSKTALKHDIWSERKGRESYRQTARDIDAVMPGGTTTEQMERLAMDMRAMAYDVRPKFAEDCVDKGLLKFLQDMADTPQYRSLHSRTMLNEFASRVASKEFAVQYGKYLAANAASSPQPSGGPGGDGEGEEGAGDMESEMNRMAAISEAMDKASGEVDAAIDMDLLLGAGQEQGDGSKYNYSKMAELFAKMRNDDFIRKVAAMAGRFRRLAQACQRQKPSHGMDDVVGVYQDGIIERLLPAELAAMCVPGLKLDVMRRIVERQAMCRDHRSYEGIGHGPIVVCVDESGSMDGERIVTAKALACSLAWIARHQNRWCALVGFGCASESSVHVIPPKGYDKASFMKWIVHMFGGGTENHVPYYVVPHHLWPNWQAEGMPKGKTDMIVITDGDFGIDEDQAIKFNEWRKKEHCSTITLCVGTSSRRLDIVSDKLFHVNTIKTTDTEVTQILSI